MAKRPPSDFDRRRAGAHARHQIKPPEWLVMGAIVNYCSVIGEPPTELGLEVREAPAQLPSGHWVVWLKGKAACVAVDACQQPQPLGGGACAPPAATTEPSADETCGVCQRSAREHPCPALVLADMANTGDENARLRGVIDKLAADLERQDRAANERISSLKSQIDGMVHVYQAAKALAAEWRDTSGSMSHIDAMNDRCNAIAHEVAAAHRGPLAERAGFLPGFDRIGRLDAVGRRSLWMRFEPGPSAQLVLRAGREGDDLTVTICSDNPLYLPIVDIMCAARFAAEWEDPTGRALEFEQYITELETALLAAYGHVPP